jgi:hypothetical protein
VETRTTFALRNVVAQGDGDLGGVVRARVRFDAAAGLPSQWVVGDRAITGRSGIPIGGNGSLRDEDARSAPASDPIPVDLAGRRFAVLADDAATVLDLTTRLSIAGAAADGSCGMVVRYPESIELETGLRARLRIDGDDNEWTADIAAEWLATDGGSTAPETTVDAPIRQYRLSLDTAGLPVGPRQTLAWTQDAAISLMLPTLPARSGARSRVSVRTGVDAECGFVAAADARAVFGDGGVRVAPTHLQLYTSNHASADVRSVLGSVRDGVSVTVTAMPASAPTRVHLVIRGTPELRSEPVTYCVHPARDVAPEPLVRVRRNVLRKSFSVVAERGLDARSDDDAPLSYALSVTLLAPDQEER